MSFEQMNADRVLEFSSLAQELEHKASEFRYVLWLYKQSHKQDPYWLESLHSVNQAIREIERLAHVPDYIELVRI